MARKKRLCLDFDGVLHSYVSKWTSATEIPDPPVRGALDFLKEAVDRFSVSVYSARTQQQGGIHVMKAWLQSQLMKKFGSGEADRIMARVTFPEERPTYDLFIDDHGFQFTGTFPSMDEIEDFVPWTKGKTAEEVGE